MAICCQCKRVSRVGRVNCKPWWCPCQVKHFFGMNRRVGERETSGNPPWSFGPNGWTNEDEPENMGSGRSPGIFLNTWGLQVLQPPSNAPSVGFSGQRRNAPRIVDELKRRNLVFLVRTWVSVPISQDWKLFWNLFWMPTTTTMSWWCSRLGCCSSSDANMSCQLQHQYELPTTECQYELVML